MRRQLVARFWHSLIVVLFATTLSFFLIRMAPGDHFSYEGRQLPPETVAQLRHDRGYDRPLAEQYVLYMRNLAHGELGWSFVRRERASAALAQALPRTLLLVGMALCLSFVFGIMIGVLQAAHAGRWFDRISSSILLWFYSVPDFWAALMILLLFASWWHILPAGDMVDTAMHESYGPWDALMDRLKHLILPVGSLTLLTMAGISRYQRAALLETLPADFIRTARAKGLSEHGVLWRHALRTSLTPMITLLGLTLPALLGGAVFIENVFSWPGMGLLAAKAIGARDYDIVTATVIIGAVMVVIGNLLADLLQMALDPRVRE